MPRLEAVIARYEEDISWVRALPMPAIVYNKGKSSTGLEGDIPVIQRPNVGREAETFLYYIVDRYESLPDYVAFLQGDPFAHCKNVIHTLTGNPDPKRVIPLSTNWKRERIGNYDWQGFEECIVELERILDIPTRYVGYATGAQYLAPKEAILSRPKSVYQELLKKVNQSVAPFEAWGMERLWGYVFGWKDKTEKVAFDVVLLPGAGVDFSSIDPSFAESIRMANDLQSDIEFSFLDIRGSGEAWWTELLNRSQDLVCFVRPDQKIFSNNLVELCGAYRSIKHEYLKEDDLCLGLGDDPQLYFPQNLHPVRVVHALDRHWRELLTPTQTFVTHRSVLAQHADLFKAQGLMPDTRTLLIQRGIPAFGPMPGISA